MVTLFLEHGASLMFSVDIFYFWPQPLFAVVNSWLQAENLQGSMCTFVRTLPKQANRLKKKKEKKKKVFCYIAALHVKCQLYHFEPASNAFLGYTCLNGSRPQYIASKLLSHKSTAETNSRIYQLYKIGFRLECCRLEVLYNSPWT